jgi:adenosylmethionine-8-amino-7-oxononanoate aminotransferase
MPFTAHQDHADYPPVVMSRGAGIYLYGADGKRYIDAIGSWWVSALGHCNPKTSEAVRAQLDKLEHMSMAGFISEPTLELAEILGELLPKRLTKIFFSDNGSTAVEVALKIALQCHALRGSGRREIVALGGGYHGDTLGAVSAGSIPAFHGLFHERFKGQRFTDEPYCFRCPARMPSPQDCGAECMDSLSKILGEIGERVAACVFEPMVQGAAGMRVYPAKVLRKIFDICRRHGVLTIADEVATGLGRTGEMFACDHAGVTPDIMCIAKGMTGGFLPIAATAVSGEIYEEFKGSRLSPEKTFYHGHTFTGNPLASAAAVAHIKQLVDAGLPRSAEPVAKHFFESIMKFDGHPNISGIRHLGFIGAFELVKDKLTKKKFPAEERMPFRITQKALEKGLIIRPLGDTIYFTPPFNATVEEIDMMFGLTRDVIGVVL